MPPTRPLKVFLCHASADKPAVRKLYRYLKERKMDPWLDAENLLPGQNWQVEIPKALLSSDVIIICLSKSSVDKEGYIQKEIKFALDKALEIPEGRIFLIPARLEECSLPHSLSTFHYVDLFEEDGYRRLLKSLRLRAEQIGAAKVSTQAESSSLPETQKDEIGGKDEKDKREAKEKAEREKVEFEAGEKLAREKIEFEKAEKESVKRVEREKMALAAKEKLAREGAEREAKEKLARENADRGAKEKAKHEIKVQPIVEEPVAAKPQPKKQSGTKFPLWGFGVIVFAVLALIVWGLSSLPASPVRTPTPSVTQTVFVGPATKTPMPATSTETVVPTPILAIGSTMIGKDDATLMYVPEGEFTMGSDVRPDEQPIHKVTLDAFWIDQTEVTNKQYAQCLDDGVCQHSGSISSSKISNYYENPKFANYPVINVTWNEAATYCKWADRRLPTEAEWEKAARGTDGRTYPWGNDAPNDTLLNYKQNIGDTTEVGKYPNGKSIYGAYDMAGNVWEWVNDWYQSGYYATLGDSASNPQGPSSGDGRVLRGGSWYDNDSLVRSASRGRSDPSDAVSYVGFRCARSFP